MSCCKNVNKNCVYTHKGVSCVIYPNKDRCCQGPIGLIGPIGPTGLRGQIGPSGSSSGFALRGGIITEETTLTDSESGTIYLVEVSDDGNFTINLPNAAEGLYFKFVVIAENNNKVVIQTGNGHFYGNINSAGSIFQINSWDTIFFHNSAVIGDNIELYGVDDSHWFILGQCVIGGSINSSG